MKYMGSKNRISKYILPIMLEHRKDRYWVEPFVGGGNTIDKVDGVRFGSDSNKYVIEALKSIRDNILELPKNNKEFTESDYTKLKYSDEYKHKGYAGFAFSYAGKWLGGWCRDKDLKRDYVSEAYRNALKQNEKLQGCIFSNKPYQELLIPKNSLIYCDPPYYNTTNYSTGFNHELFWEWCRNKQKEGHIIFISEYVAPKDFKCVWSKSVNNTLVKDTGSKTGVEKLFVHESFYGN